MALSRFERLDAGRRHRLIAAAAVEFAAKGYEGATLGTIAHRAQITKASVYYYFADKADLCTTVLEEGWRRLSAQGRIDLPTLTLKSFWPALERIARENLELCRREPWLLAASKLLNRPPRNPAGPNVLDEYRKKRQAWEAAFIGRGQMLGAIRKDVPSGLLLAISLEARQSSNLWLLDHMEELGPEECERLALHVFDMYRTLLSPSADGQASSETGSLNRESATLESHRSEGHDLSSAGASRAAPAAGFGSGR